MGPFANSALSFPDSRYARELDKAGGKMKFPPGLEAEYQDFYLRERRSHVRSFNLVICALIACALARSLWLGTLTESLRAGVVGRLSLCLFAHAVGGLQHIL